MKGFLAYTFLLNCLLASAQFPSVSFKNIGINQGLSQSSVVDIAFDQNGFVWLATQDGLNRYDGQDFIVYDKKFDDITSGSFSRLGKIVPGNDHSLWIISKSGQLEQLNLITNVFKPISLNPGKNKVFITCLLPEEGGTIWLGTGNGKLLLYDHKKNRVIREINVDAAKEPAPVNAIFRDSRQRIWVLGKKVGYVADNRVIYDTVYASGKKQPGVVFSCIAEDKEGNIWLGSLGQGLFVKKGSEPFCSFKEYDSELPSNLVIEDILADDEGKIWVGTYGKGLFVVDRQQQRVQHYVYDKKNPFSLAFNDVLSIRQNSNKDVWIGTDGGGVSYYNKQKNNFILFSDQTVPPDIEIAMVRSIATDRKGAIWVGTTNKGLTRIDPDKGQYKTWRFPSYKKDIYNPDRIVSLYVDKEGIVWAGTQGNGLLLFDPQKEKTIKWFHPDAAPPLYIPDATVWSIYPKGESEIWIGTESGRLCLFSKENGCVGSYRYANDQSIENNAVRCITQMNDSLLCVGFSKTGVQFFNIIQRKFQQPESKELEAFFATETNIKSLHYQKPFLWIGTDGRGIVVLNTETGKCSPFSVQDGLPNNTIYGILQDHKGFLWVSTNKGLSNFKPVVLNGGIQIERFVNYNVAHGLQSNEFNTGAYCKALDGTLLFGGISGLNVFHPSDFNKPDQKIPVVFTNILIDNEAIKGDSSAAFKKHVHLLPKNNSIAFSFAALNFSSIQQSRYFYKLESYDKEWINAGQRNYASYTNIPAGDYRFLVKYAKEANDAAPVAEMLVAIEGPFWKSWWFIILALLVMSGIVYSLYRYRVAQMLQVFKIRQRIASDLHDDIGSTLSNINILSELSRKSLHSPAQAQTFLERISEEVHSSSQSLDDIIWSVNLHNDTWPETFSRMRRYAAEVFENSNIHYAINVTETEGMTKLNMEKRRDVFLIYKELLNNIHKHAAATEVKIDMWFQKQQLVMKLQDNGKGFDKHAPTHRNGLKNLSKRVARWKGSMELHSGREGTTVQITI